jgi:uroporphyrinogen-III decarboxylase
MSVTEVCNKCGLEIWNFYDGDCVCSSDTVKSLRQRIRMLEKRAIISDKFLQGNISPSKLQEMNEYVKTKLKEKDE